MSNDHSKKSREALARSAAKLVKAFPDPAAPLRQLTKDINRAALRLKLNYWHALSRQEQNPFYAWAAWKAAREAKVEAPDWVTAYLDSCAERLLELASVALTADERDDANIGTLAALGMASSERRAHTAYRRAERERIVSAEMHEAVAEGSSVASAAKQAVTRYGLSEGHWRNVYYRLRGFWETPLSEL